MEKPEKEEAVTDYPNEQTRQQSKRSLRTIVIAVVLIALLGIAYYYNYSASGTNLGSVLVAVRGYLSEEQRATLQTHLQEFSPEEDVEISLEIYEFPMEGSSSNNEEISRLLSKILGKMEGGECALLLLDQSVFNMIGDERLFENLADRYPGNLALQGEYLYNLAGNPFAQVPEMKDMPDLYLALRNSLAGSGAQTPATTKRYEFQSQLLDRVVEAG